MSIYNEYNNTYNRAGLKNLEQKGYKFDGWWTKLVGGEQIILADGNATGVQYFNYQKQQTLYAHWTLNKVTLDGNGATNDITEPELSYSEDYTPGAVESHYEQKYKVVFSDKSKNLSTVLDSEVSYLNYTLLGWALSESDAQNGIIAYEADLSDLDLSPADLGAFTLYAVWDDGSLSYPQWDKSSVGYKNLQWYSDEECSSVLNTEDAKTSNADIKRLAIVNKKLFDEYKSNVYAGFTPIAYTIVFDANGGTGRKSDEPNHSADIDPNYSLNLNTSGFNESRIGYRFIGWSTSRNGDVVYTDGSKVEFSKSPPVMREDGSYVLTLYAVWEPYKYGINYNMNIPDNAIKAKYGTTEFNASGIVGNDANKVSYPQQYKMGTEYTLPANAYSIIGWTFIGWSKSPDGSGEIYTDGATVKDLAICNRGNETITLYAVWDVDVNNVAKNVNNGDTVTNTQGTISYIVYNIMSETPHITCTGRVIIDWSLYTDETYDFITQVTSSGSRYGGGNNNLNISNAKEVYFIGNPDTIYTNVNIVHLNYPELVSTTPEDGSEPTDNIPVIHFINFNVSDSTIQVSVDETIENPHKTMVFDVSGNCSVNGMLGSRELVYDNNQVGVAISTVPVSADNTLGFVTEMKIISVEGSDTRHMGGYYHPVASSANNIYYYVVYAKIPVGYNIGMYSNAIGDGSTAEWLTDSSGTGEWEWYVGKTICGASGTFSTLGFVAIERNGGLDDRVEWYVGYSNIIDGTGQNELYPADFRDDENIYSMNAVSYNEHTYHLVPACMTWSEAKTYCEEHGGYLATITSAEENQIVQDLISGSGLPYVWLGATDSAEEGNWVWVTNEDWDFTNWNSGQPDNTNNIQPEHCLGMYTNPLGFWNDMADSVKCSFVLEIND